MLGLSHLIPVNDQGKIPKVPEAQECAICHEDLGNDEPLTDTCLDKRIQQLCHREFHQTCLDLWLANQLSDKLNGTCPICRKVLIKYEEESCLTVFFYRTLVPLFNLFWFRREHRPEHTV